MIILVVKTILIGFFASVGLGPVTVFVLKRGISSGFWSAFISGIGCSVADTFYGTVAFIGAAYAISFLESYEGYIRLAVMAVLLVIAIFMFLSKKGSPIHEFSLPKKAMVGNFLSTLMLGLSNPFLILVYLTVFSLLPLAENNEQTSYWPFISIGLVLGTSLWWFLISYLTKIFKDRMPKLLSSNITWISASLLLALALLSGISGVIKILG
jgi:threonine/homoserine/homoserine lactone efflux protein